VLEVYRATEIPVTPCRSEIRTGPVVGVARAVPAGGPTAPLDARDFAPDSPRAARAPTPTPPARIFASAKGRARAPR